MQPTQQSIVDVGEGQSGKGAQMGQKRISTDLGRKQQ